MTTTEFEIGLTNSARPSSRVLKPPGGGHSNIFAEPELAVNAPRPKYNQQNSSNLNACMGSTDANQSVVKLRDEITHTKEPSKPNATATSQNKSSINNITNGGADVARATNNAGRVPPGGHSSGGFW